MHSIAEPLLLVVTFKKCGDAQGCDHADKNSQRGAVSEAASGCADL